MKAVKLNNIKRLYTWNKMSKEEIQSIPAPEMLQYMVASQILTVHDEKLLYMTSEQLNYVPADTFSYFPKEVLKELYKQHEDETEDVIIMKMRFNVHEKIYYSEEITVSGNAIRLKNGLRLQEEKEIIQKEIDELRHYIIDNYEVEGSVPLKLVLAYIQDAWFLYYFNEKEFLKFSKIKPSSVPIPKSHKFYGDVFVKKQEVLDFINGRLENPELKFQDIPKLVSVNSLRKYKIIGHQRRYAEMKRVFGKKMHILKLKRQDLVLEEEMKMLMAFCETTTL